MAELLAAQALASSNNNNSRGSSLSPGTVFAIGATIVIVIVCIVIIIWALWYFLWKGKGDVPAGGSCSSNSDCQNDACGRQSAANDAKLICCPSGSTDNYYGYDYCTDLPAGAVCWSDAMCAGGICRGNEEGTQKGVCTGELPPNTSCEDNSDCANDACGRQTAADNAPLICCPSGSIDVYGGYGYCTGMPHGSICWSTPMCASPLICNNGNGGKGICLNPGEGLPVNSTCTANSQCSNKACGRQTAADDAPLICCPSGSIDTFGAYDYCTGMPTGSVCWSDAMCANGDCVGNMDGIRKGVCN